MVFIKNVSTLVLLAQHPRVIASRLGVVGADTKSLPLVHCKQQDELASDMRRAGTGWRLAHGYERVSFRRTR
jgi:hypothetical protein